jgi:histidyl-tRNA synthetase
MENKVKPRTLSGFMELLPQDQILFNKMYDTIRKNYEKFGFLPLDTPVIEISEVLLAKAGGETEKQIYRFMKGDNDLSLRFDLTVPLARYVAEHYNDLVFPFKRYQMSKVFRGERPQKGRFREFYQCDIDIIGNESLDIIYDAEIPTVIYNVFKELNIGDFTIRINNRKVLNGFFKNLNLSDEASDILRIIDKIDKIGSEEVIKELEAMNIDINSITKIMEFIKITGSADEVVNSLKELNVDNELFISGLNELEIVTKNLKNFKVPENYFKIDLTIARGLDYYTGTVYETILNDYPGLGSICSGGRYDNLTGYYTDQSLPGIGISIGLTRLFSRLLEEKIISTNVKSLTDVLVIPFDMNDMSFALSVASVLRNNDIKTDVYLIDKKMNQKMKYADRLGIPYVILIGEDEIKEEKVTLKNMITGDQFKLSLEELIKELTK